MKIDKKDDIQQHLSLDDVVKYMRLSGNYGMIINELIQREYTAMAATNIGISVSDSELQEASDAWRTLNKLYLASDIENWLKNSRLRLEDYERFLEISLLVHKFKQLLASDAKLNTIYSDPINQDKASDLLYLDWLVKSIK